MRLSWYQSFQELVGVPRAKRSAPDVSGDSGKGGGVELKSILSDRETDEKDSFLKSKEKEGEKEGKGDEQPPKVTPTPPSLTKKDSIEETLLCQICQVGTAPWCVRGCHL